MSETNALDAYGSLIQIGDGASPESFTSIAEVTNLTPPSITLATEGATHHESPGGYTELIATLLSVGPVTFDINFIPTEATHREASGGLIGAMTAKTRRNFKMVYPDTGLTQWVFSAFVTNFSPTAPVEGKLTASVTLSGTGQPTLA